MNGLIQNRHMQCIDKVTEFDIDVQTIKRKLQIENSNEQKPLRLVLSLQRTCLEEMVEELSLTILCKLQHSFIN